MQAWEAERVRRSSKRKFEETRQDIDGIRARCQSLSNFVEEAWHVLEPNTVYSHNWHIEAICAHLEAVTDGRITRLLINVPPGSMKSMLVSVLWPAWEWGPRGMAWLRYVATAFNDGPVLRDAGKMLNLLSSEWYRVLWPEVVLSRTAVTAFENTATGSRRGVAFGSLTSQRGDRLIIDDPHSTTTAESDIERAKTGRAFREGATNRLNSLKESAIVVIMQRLHEEDISGIILKLKLGYVHLMLPMEFEPERACKTVIGFEDPRTTDGDLLDPDRISRETYETYKRQTTAYAIAGQYQQRPAPREGGLFKRHWFEIVHAVPAGVKRVRGWDLAASETQTAAYTAGVLLAMKDGVYYVEDVRRERGSPADIERLIKNTAILDSHDVRVSIPQDPGQAAKTQVMALGKLLAGFDVRFSVESRVGKGGKEARAMPVSAQAEIGNIKIVIGDWNRAFLEEICMFPSGTYKDQVDALSRAFSELLVPVPQFVFG